MSEFANLSPGEVAAQIIRDLGAEALPYAEIEANHAFIDCDPERACFWMLVRARLAEAASI